MKKFIFTLLMGSIIACNSFAMVADYEQSKNLKTFGDPNNPTTIYVFSSLTCPHCAVFHKTIMPELKTRYADTNKAKIIYVDMPFDRKALIGATLARCATPEYYENLMDQLYETQDQWAYSKDPQPFYEAAQSAQMSDEEIQSCLQNKDLQKNIVEQRNNLAQLYKVRSMPTTILVKQGQPTILSGTERDVILNRLDKELDIQ